MSCAHCQPMTLESWTLLRIPDDGDSDYGPPIKITKSRPIINSATLGTAAILTNEMMLLVMAVLVAIIDSTSESQSTEDRKPLSIWS
jgi:hypothetical protein